MSAAGQARSHFASFGFISILCFSTPCAEWWFTTETADIQNKNKRVAGNY